MVEFQPLTETVTVVVAKLLLKSETNTGYGDKINNMNFSFYTFIL